MCGALAPCSSLLPPPEQTHLESDTGRRDGQIGGGGGVGRVIPAVCGCLGVRHPAGRTSGHLQPQPGTVGPPASG